MKAIEKIKEEITSAIELIRYPANALAIASLGKALALLKSEEKPVCKTCGGSRRKHTGQNLAPNGYDDTIPCPDCKNKLSEFVEKCTALRRKGANKETGR
jgi:tRNA(Ile2) C34 agmatinyltransferase TiaS